MNRLSFIASLSAVVFLGAATSASADVSRHVNCDKGQSIQKALDTSSGYGGAIEVVIRGLCEENIVIARDVVIRGVNGAQIFGQVTISGARNVEMSDLTITGPGNGLVNNTGNATLQSVNLTGNAGSAIIARRNATVRAWDCQISNNLTESEGGNTVALTAAVAWFRQTDVVDNHGWGINVFNGSQLEVTGGTIRGNSGPGIHVIDGSQLRIFEAEIADNEATGIVVRLSSNTWIEDVSIHGNHQEGLSVTEVSSARVFGTTISDNYENGIGTAAHAYMSIVNSKILDNGGDGLFLYRDAGAEIDSDTQIPANGSGWAIVCAGKEASVDIDPGAWIGPVDCVDPEF